MLRGYTHCTLALRLLLLLSVSVLCLISFKSSAAPEQLALRISPTIPEDLNAPAGALEATLEQAAIFAWREFISLNWPAAPGHRDIPDPTGNLSAKNTSPRVWETFRGRVEVYPGIGRPFDAADAEGDYGYEKAPRYIYDPAKVGSSGSAPGGVGSCPGAFVSGAVPWNNLDEPDHQNVRSGLSPKEPWPGQQLLVESKVNRKEYVYVAARGWYGENPIRIPRKHTGEFVRKNLAAPPPPASIDDPADTEYISLPTGTIEIKAAWRRLGPGDDPTKIYTSPVRYYALIDGKPCYVDSDAPDRNDRWGLVALHVIQKTPSAPYFIWATFEHANTLVADKFDRNGRIVPLENADGSLTPAGKAMQSPFSPNLLLRPATHDKEQELVVDPKAAATPDKQLYYHQEAEFDFPELKYVAVNRRMLPIPGEIVRINRMVQTEIRKTSPDSPFQYYRLASVQWVPLDKKPEVEYTGPYPPAIYYAANMNIEPPPVHQHFSGQFTVGFTKTSDYLNKDLPFMNPKPNPADPIFQNTYFRGKGYLTGGCMGCHGSKQVYGTDWSFLLDRQRVTVPEIKIEGAPALE